MLSKDAVFCLKVIFNGAISTSACVKDLNIQSNIPPKPEFHLSEYSSTMKQDRIFWYALRSDRNLLPVLNYELNKTKFSKHAAFSQRNLQNFSAFRSSKSIFLFHGWVVNSDTSRHRHTVLCCRNNFCHHKGMKNKQKIPDTKVLYF